MFVSLGIGSKSLQIVKNYGYAGSGQPQGPFPENNLFPRKVGLRWVFVNGLKWSKKWVFGCKSGLKVGQNPLSL